MAFKRSKMSKHRSKKVFRRNALKTHKKNLLQFAGPMRGGIRL